MKVASASWKVVLAGSFHGVSVVTRLVSAPSSPSGGPAEGKPAMGLSTLIGPLADASAQLARHQAAHERLEVALVAGVEAEGVEVRQPQRRPGWPSSTRPRSLVRPETSWPSPACRPASKRRHQERGVAGLRVEPPRAHQPGDDRTRRAAQRGGEAAVARHLGVRPVPGVIERLQRARRAHVDRGQRLRRRGDRRELAAFQHHQGEPRAEPVARRCGRGEQPRQVGQVELDAGQVVRLVVGGAVLGVGPDHVPRRQGRARRQDRR